jgi:hypothetical protein
MTDRASAVKNATAIVASVVRELAMRGDPTLNLLEQEINDRGTTDLRYRLSRVRNTTCEELTMCMNAAFKAAGSDKAITVSVNTNACTGVVTVPRDHGAIKADEVVTAINRARSETPFVARAPEEKKTYLSPAVVLLMSVFVYIAYCYMSG